MAERVQVRELGPEEGNRLLRILRRGTGSVVTWRRAQMILLSAQGMPVSQIAEVTFTSPDRVRDVIHNFNTDAFDSLYPRYRGGRPPTFTLKQRQQIKKVALSRPRDHDLPFIGPHQESSPRDGKNGSSPDRGRTTSGNRALALQQRPYPLADFLLRPI